MSQTEPNRDTTAAGSEDRPEPDATDRGTPPGAPAAPLDDEDDEAFLSWKLLVAVAVVLAVVAVGAWVLVGGSKKDETATRTGTSAPLAQELPAVRDDFDRPDNGTTLGKTTTGEDWVAVSGTWGVKERQAYVAAKNTSGPRNMAVVDLGSGDGSVQAKASKLVDGWGLVFRYRGPNAWWAIKAVPKVGTFNIVKFQNGEEVRVDNSGLTKLTDAMTVRVEFVGQSITVFLDGNPVRTVNDPYLVNDGTQAGLFADGPASVEARWAEFVARKGTITPLVTAVPKPGTPGSATGGGANGAAKQPAAPTSSTAPSGPTTTAAAVPPASSP